MDEYIINLLGPLTVHINLKVENAATFVGQIHQAKFYNLFYGGSFPKIARILRHFGCQSKIIGYVGNDEFGEKIINTMKMEGFNTDIQKISSSPTPVQIQLEESSGFSTYTTKTSDLTLWKHRIKKFTNNEIIFIDPNVPSTLQMEIIENSKNALIILRKPVDNNFDVFKTNKNLLIILNEWEAFTIFMDFEKNYFNSIDFLKANLLSNHKVLVESKKHFAFIDEHGTISELVFSKTKSKQTVINDYFLGATIAGIASKVSYQTAFTWGLIASSKQYIFQDYTKLEVSQLASKFYWNEV